MNQSPLTYHDGVTFFSPGASLEACFLTSDFEVQQGWVKAAISRTWLFVADISVDWLATCPGSGDLVRIGIGEANPSQGGWAKDFGVDALADENALNEAVQASPPSEKPSFKLWLHETPTSQGRVEYLGSHEFGHVLGFEDEGSNDEEECEDIAMYGVTPDGIPLTEYDIDSEMNYCNQWSNARAVLTGFDVQGAQSVYGMGPRYVAAISTTTLTL